MPRSDFDVDSLAAYLHVSPAQIGRLAERGKIPCRKVGGKWKFSRPEIHHWLEERIGLSDDAELIQMEGVLRRAALGGDEPVTLEYLLPPEAVAVPLLARTKSRVISQMTELAAETGWLWDAKTFAEAVEARESMQSTALDSGVALLHPRRPLASLLERSLLALGTTQTGIPFGSSRGTLTDIYFLICSTEDQMYLRILARLSRLVGDLDLLAQLRQASDPASARKLLIEADEQLG